MGSDSSTINTEAIVLRSRILVAQLVDELNLVDDPDFNSRLRPAPKLSLSRILGREETEAPSPEAVRNGVIDAVLNSVSVENIRQSFVFEISATVPSPQKAVLIANTLAEFYIKDQIRAKLVATEDASTFLSARASELQLELKAAEAALKEFNDSTELVNPEALLGLQRQVKELRDRIASATEARDQGIVRLQSVRSLAAEGNYEGLADLVGDPRLFELLPGLRAGTVDEAVFAATVQDVLLRAEIETTRAAQQLDAIIASEVTLSERISVQSDDLVTQQDLVRAVESTKLLYESFLQRLKETNVQIGLQQADSRLLSEAVPRAAVSPRKARILALAAILGALVGVGAVLLRELQFASFRTSDELREQTGQTVLGSIPLIPGGTRRDALDYLRAKPSSVVAEAVRNLRTSILLSNLDAPPKVIMVTSSIPGEGKTTLALALAQNMAGLGRRVILVEGDIRRRIFAEYFNVAEGVSLLDAMSDPAALDDAAVHQPDLGVDLLVATKAHVNAADLFSSEKFGALIAELRQRYDYVLIDTPPVLAVPDARVIGPHADAILYAVLWNTTTRTQVRQGLDMFSSVGLKVSGLVLSKVDPKQMRRYGYGGQYGYDAYRSKYYDS
jgi:capsular exopolysaccharide synthesis family protein